MASEKTTIIVNYGLIVLVIAMFVAIMTLLDEKTSLIQPANFPCDPDGNCPTCFQDRIIYISECVEGFCRLCVKEVYQPI